MQGAQGCDLLSVAVEPDRAVERLLLHHSQGTVVAAGFKLCIAGEIAAEVSEVQAIGVAAVRHELVPDLGK